MTDRADAIGPSAAESPATPPGAWDLYRQLARSAAGTLTAERRRAVGMAVALALIAGYFAIRGFDLPDRWLSLWTIALGVTCLFAPSSGLVVLLATVPFPDWFRIERDVGAKIILVALLGLGLAIRVLVVRSRLRGWVDRLAVLAWLVFAATLMHTVIRFGAPLATTAELRFLVGIPGGLIVFLVARRAGRDGNLLVLVIAVAAGTLAAAVSLSDLLSADLIRGGWLEWTLRATRTTDRVTGIINGPNAVATLCTAAAAPVFAWLTYSRDRRRWLLAPVAIILVVAAALTLSRSGLLAILLIAVSLVAYRRPRLAIAVLAVGLVAAVVLTPVYLQWRATALGAGTNIDLGSLLSGDTKRWTAWTTGLRLWLDAPFTGWGSYSFIDVRSHYAVDVVSHPHNEVIRLLVDGGIGMAAVFLAFVVAVIRELEWRRGPIQLGGLATLVALAVGAMFNNPLQFIQVTAIGFAIVGSAVGYAQGARAVGDDREARPAESVAAPSVAAPSTTGP